MAATWRGGLLCAWGPVLLLASACLAQAQSTEKPKPQGGPPVVLSESSAAGGITLSEVGHPEVSVPLHWVEKSGSRVSLTLEATPLSNGRGQEVRPVFGPGAASAAQFTLDPRGIGRVQMQATLIEPGTYRGLLRATVVNGAVKEPLDPVPVTITRTLAASLVEFSGTAPRLETASFPMRPLTVEVPLQAAVAASGVVLLPPRVTQAVRRAAVDSPEGMAVDIGLADAPVAAPVRVEPGQVSAVPVKLTGFTEPGRYDVGLRFDLAGYKPLDMQLKVLVREPWSLALFFVFVGVAVSFLMQLWSVGIKPARELRQRVLALQELVGQARQRAGDALADPEVDGLLRDVERQLTARASGVWYRPPRQAVGVEVYDAIVSALGPWVSLWRQLGQVRPEAVRDVHRQVLADAKRRFVAPAPDGLLVKEAIQSMEVMPDKIRADMAAALKAAITQLAGSIDRGGSVAMLQLSSNLRAASDRLASGQLEAAVSLYDRVLRDYVAEMTKALQARIDAAAPPGLTPQEWAELTGKVKSELAGIGAIQGPEAALAQLAAATDTYVRQFAGGLARAVEKMPKDSRKVLDEARARVDQALDRRDLTGAWQGLAEVQAAYADLQRAAGQPMGDDKKSLLARAASPMPLDAPAGDALAFDLPAWWERFRQPGTADRLGQQNLWVDAGVSVLALVLAGLTGVQAVWVPNLVWGGPAAYLAAVLLGFATDRFIQMAVSAWRR